MVITPLEIYQIVEADDGVLVLPASANLQGMKFVRLVRCTIDIVPDFLGRYLRARSEGKSIREAYSIAIGKAIIVGDAKALEKVAIKGDITA